MYKLPGGTTEISRLQIGDMFLIGLPEHLDRNTDQKELSCYLYKVQKLSGGESRTILTFRKHADARADGEAKKSYLHITSLKEWEKGRETLRPRPVKVDVLGKIRWL